MKEGQSLEKGSLGLTREGLFNETEKELSFPIKVYRLGERFEGLKPELAEITMLDVTEIPGCHYGAKNVFVPIIRRMESSRKFGGKSRMTISPETAILVEPSTGNGWVAFSDACEKLGYEHIVVMPDGLPESRYQHPDGRQITIIKTPKEDYAQGLPKQMKVLLDQNRQRVKNGKKTYASPNHAVAGAEITIEVMSDLARQLLANLGKTDNSRSLRIVVSMGNGASLCAIGEYLKRHSPNAKVVATESLAYGGGYDRFAKSKGYASYKELFGIDPGDPNLMAKFSTFGTNVPIGIELPLQERAFNGNLINNYALFTDDKVLQAFRNLQSKEHNLKNALELPCYTRLPSRLFETYGNSTLANIAVASRFTLKGEHVVAMAYDGRKNY